MSRERDAYLQMYDSLPQGVKDAMHDLWEKGRNHSGVWVRFGDVEATVARIVEAIRHEEEQGK